MVPHGSPSPREKTGITTQEAQRDWIGIPSLSKPDLRTSPEAPPLKGAPHLDGYYFGNLGRQVMGTQSQAVLPGI